MAKTESKMAYKRLMFGYKTDEKTIQYAVNKEGLNGWELFSRFISPTPKSKHAYHFRKKKINKQ